MFIVIPLKRKRDVKHFFLLNFALLAVVLTPKQMELNLLHLHKKEFTIFFKKSCGSAVDAFHYDVINGI